LFLTLRVPTQVCENIMKHIPQKQSQAHTIKDKQRRIFTVLVQNEPGMYCTAVAKLASSPPRLLCLLYLEQLCEMVSVLQTPFVMGSVYREALDAAVQNG
jgi:hypothetical protein